VRSDQTESSNPAIAAPSLLPPEQLTPAQEAALAVLHDARELVACGPLGDLLELCRQRIYMLMHGSLAGDDPLSMSPKSAALADYPTSPLFEDVERVALEFTEQYVMDVAGMADELVAELQEMLGPKGLYSFTFGLFVMDQSERLLLTVGAKP
jgi:hypothetical protein